MKLVDRSNRFVQVWASQEMFKPNADTYVSGKARSCEFFLYNYEHAIEGMSDLVDVCIRVIVTLPTACNFFCLSNCMISRCIQPHTERTIDTAIGQNKVQQVFPVCRFCVCNFVPVHLLFFCKILACKPNFPRA